MKKLRRIN